MALLGRNAIEINMLKLPTSKAPDPPKSKEYQTIYALLDSCEYWRDRQNKEIEAALWDLIAQFALKYSKDLKPKDEDGTINNRRK